MNRAPCHSLGTNVSMTIKGKLNFLALMWVQGAVQWQDVKNLQINREFLLNANFIEAETFPKTTLTYG